MKYDEKFNPSLDDLISGAKQNADINSEEISMKNIVDEIDFMSVLSANQTEFNIEKENNSTVAQVDLIKKNRKKKNRIVVYKTRVTVEEAKEIDEKINKSGLRKGEFIRKCLLEKEIHELSDVNEIIGLRNDIARVGGLLKLFVKQNSENKQVSLEEISEVKKVLNELEKLLKKVDKEVVSRWQ